MSQFVIPLCNRCGVNPRTHHDRGRLLDECEACYWMCRVCGEHPRMQGDGRRKQVCASCYGKCRDCGASAPPASSGAYRKYCGDCRPKHENTRETCSLCGGPRDGGHKSYCRPCERERDRRRRQENHAKFALKDRKRALKRHFGMTLEDYDLLLASQGGACAGCGATASAVKIPTGQSDRGARGKLHVDHCHTTGKVRGILCAACNAALGRVRDNPDTLRRLAAYLDGGLG